MFSKLFYAIFALVILLGCETPYSGNLGPGDFNGWIQSSGDEALSALNNGPLISIVSK